MLLSQSKNQPKSLFQPKKGWQKVYSIWDVGLFLLSVGFLMVKFAFLFTIPIFFKSYPVLSLGGGPDSMTQHVWYTGWLREAIAAVFCMHIRDKGPAGISHQYCPGRAGAGG